MAAALDPACPRFPDGDVEQDPGAAAQKLTVALEQKPDDAEYYCQRAYAHILLQNYWDAVADAKKSLELNPNNATAFLRKGISEYHIKNYDSALESFKEGQKLDNVDTSFPIWIKRCEETLNKGSQTEMTTQQQTQPSKIKYDWYQTESQVIVTLMIKNAQKDDISVQFSEKELNALVRLPSGEDYNLKLVLLHSIVPEQSTFKVLSTKESRMMTQHMLFDLRTLTAVLTKCKEGTNMRFLKMAMALDPRLKSLKCHPKSERDVVWNMLSKLLKEQHSDAETTEPKPPKKKINLLLMASDSDDESEHALVRSALDHYRAEPVISMDAYPLEWWLKHEGTYESLVPLACKYLAMLVTKEPCKRLFLLSGDIVNKKRAALSPTNVTKLICLRDWLT
ncbi:protein SGT1 homolog isoform X1 [Dermochelys coriacea]|uniref:protein SGT1 homolog isoform X1 n=1 Tax=Dermochelys coriacea TaxID=27794 RepID=UPI001CA8BCE1|nr:protein SGT1 homolog isoform X1 [Dermochelys coriacea]